MLIVPTKNNKAKQKQKLNINWKKQIWRITIDPLHDITICWMKRFEKFFTVNALQMIASSFWEVTLNCFFIWKIKMVTSRLPALDFPSDKWRVLMIFFRAFFPSHFPKVHALFMLIIINLSAVDIFSVQSFSLLRANKIDELFCVFLTLKTHRSGKVWLCCVFLRFFVIHGFSRFANNLIISQAVMNFLLFDCLF